MYAAPRPRSNEAEILEPIDRQVRERVIDHQVVHVRVADAGLLESLSAGDANAFEL